MVEIKYINGDIENVESVEPKNGDGHFTYLNDSQLFVVYTIVNSRGEVECMMIPREFVKSIRHIEVE